MVRDNIRRAISVAIPAVTALLLFGVIEAMFGIKIDENLFSTGITPGIVFAVLNVLMFWWVFKHRIP